MTASALPRRRARIIAVPAHAWSVLTYGLIAVLPLLLCAPFLAEPMEQDEGVYFSVAMWSRIPYASVFDHKPPLVYAWYHLALLLNGGAPSIEAVRLLAALQISLAAIGVAVVGRMLGGRRVGVIAGLLMALSAADQYLQFNANTEVFLLPPLVWSLAAFAHGWRHGSARSFAIAGALAGVAAMTKSVAVLHVVALLGVLAWAWPMRQLDARAALRSALALSAGAAVVVAACAAPFALAGHWSAFWHANVTYNAAYSSQIGFEDKLFAVTAVNPRAVLGGLPLFVLGGAGAVLLLQRGASMAAALLTASALAAFAGASVTGREYAHYWVPLMPFLALFAAVALGRIGEGWRSARTRVHAEALLIALAVPAIFALVPLYVLGSEDAHLRKYGDGVNARRAIEIPAIAERVRALSSADDEIFVFGDEAQIYALARRRPATYYVRAVAAIDLEAAGLDRIMRELEAEPPRVIADTARVETGAALLGLDPRPVTLDVAPEARERFDAFVRQRYEFAGRVAFADLWVLR